MPQALEECVASLQAKWKKDPSSRPTPRKDKSGKPQDAKSQAFAICTSSLQKAGKMEDELTAIALEGSGITLMGIGLTNRPYLKGLPPIKIVEREVGGEKKEQLRIPFLLQGIFKHSKGNLVFNPKVYARMIGNLEKNILEQDICVDSRHNPDWGALGWLGPNTPGTTLREEDDMLVAYADLTPLGKEKVEQKSFRYASAEFSTNFQHPRIGGALEAAKLSTDDIDILTLSELAEQEAIMPANDEPKNNQPDNEAMLLELQEERQKRERLEARLVKLEEEGQKAEELEKRLADTERRLVESEERLALSDEEKYVALVDSVMTRAEHYRDKDGKGHPKMLLDVARSLLLMETIKGDDEDVVKLEHEEDQEPTSAQIHKFYHDAVVYLLENLPGLVPTEGGAHPEDERPGGGEEDTTKLQEEVKEFMEKTGGPVAPADEED